MKRLISIFIITFCLLGPFVSYAQQSNAPSTPPPSAKEQSDASGISVIATNNRVKIINAPARSKLEIYSVVGIKVYEIEMKQPDGEYVLDIAKGYYIVRIGETVCKIAIR